MPNKTGDASYPIMIRETRQSALPGEFPHRQSAAEEGFNER
jgi:hypothetical protein